MPDTLTTSEQLRIISRAWGKQVGYCFFPWIRGDAENKEQRIRGYNEGPAFRWPSDKDKIIEHLEAHRGDDLYWCPSLFERRRRRIEFAMDEHALWADLDEVDPSNIEEFVPTVAWETSPNRYQALWLFSRGDLQGASWPGNENQKLTYYLGADSSGWDSTQLLRIPGWRNHKPEYKEANGGEPVVGRLLWKDGRRYLPDEFSDLPDVPTAVEVEEVLESEIDRVDRREVWARVRLKIRSDVRQYFAAKEAVGDRSDVLWQIERELADAGCSVSEIVAVVRPLVWNKYDGRADELKRLITEASKAVAQRSDEVREELEEELEPRKDPYDFWTSIDNAPPPTWLIRNIWTKGTVGFIAGQPKSHKSWLMLDMALSLASGADFLNHFPVLEPGPVLFLEEEDGFSTLKDRRDKVWPSKFSDRIVQVDGELVWMPAEEMDPKADRPPIMAMIREGITLTDPGWQVWLDDVLEAGYKGGRHDGEKFAMVLIDSLMMIAGDVEENRAQSMTTKLFKPLKELAEKHDVAICLIHHMKKGDGDRRGGQRLLGSVANHAWAENSLYISIVRGGDLHVEVESKAAPGGSFRISGIRRRGWDPVIHSEQLGGDGEDDAATGDRSGNNRGDTSGSGREGRTNHAGKRSKVIAAITELGAGKHSTKSIAEVAGIQSNSAYRQLVRKADQGQVHRHGNLWSLEP